MNDDFEIMPRGTAVELCCLRTLAKLVDQLLDINYYQDKEAESPSKYSVLYDVKNTMYELHQHYKNSSDYLGR